MISYLIKLWKEYSFEIILGLSLAFILFYGLYCKFKKKKGTWSKKVYYNPLLSKKNNLHKPQQQSPYHRPPPKESKGELECRRVLQEIFKKPFYKSRPSFLNNPVTGGNFNLELDCYEPTLNIALEYNGIQHYKYIPYFHRNKEAFLNQKYRDDMKRRICKENGVLLIEVPYSVKIEDIKSYILSELNKNKLN